MQNCSQRQVTKMSWLTGMALPVNVLLSVVGAFVCHGLIAHYMPIFVTRRMAGRDLCKTSQAPVPEPLGVIAAAVFLILMFLFIPIAFLGWQTFESTFPWDRFVAFLAGLLSVCTAILLGFADDMLDLRWRHKLLFPTLSSLPVLLVYYATGSSTSVVLPKVVYNLVAWLPKGGAVNIGPLYYIFLAMLIVFCTNAINILAGVNGLEVGQSLVVAASVAIFNVVQLIRLDSQEWYQILSLYFLLPFIGCSAALYAYNRYPARVFVGDTYCYWAGMTLAVVAIQGHFSKTLLLFLVPQVFNFLYSIPQLFHWVPCPRHRLPKYVAEEDRLHMSLAVFKASELKPLGSLALAVFKAVGLLHRRDFEKDDERWIEINNLTVLNVALLWGGSVHEATLTRRLLGLQIVCSLLAFAVRFYGAQLVYDAVH